MDELKIIAHVMSNPYSTPDDLDYELEKYERWYAENEPYEYKEE